MTHDTRSAPVTSPQSRSADERKEAARATYRQSLDQRAPMTGAQLGYEFDRSPRWGNDRIQEVRRAGADRDNGSSAVNHVGSNGHGQTADDHDLADSAASMEPTTADVVGPPLSAMETTEPVGVAPGMRRARVLAVVMVAAAAAVVSFDHQRVLAELAGEGWRAFLLPLSVDGMLLAASLTALERRRAGQPVGGVVWFALALGVLASMAANVAAAEPSLEGRLVAAWPPVALKLSLAMLLTRGE